MPDVIGVARRGKNMLIEVVSKSQTVAQMEAKCLSMELTNINTTHRVRDWARVISKVLW